MAFTIKCNFVPIRSYSDALKAWENSPRFRKDANEFAPRALAGRRKKHMTVHRGSEGDIILTLYGTPVVTWHDDNSVETRMYDSRSTVRFANHCSPFAVVYHKSILAALCGDRLYRLKNGVMFREHSMGWAPDTVTPWKIPHVDRRLAAAAVRETNFLEFSRWLQVYVRMATCEFLQIAPMSDELLDMLRNRSQWRALALRLPMVWGESFLCEVGLSQLRQFIYERHGCIKNEIKLFLER